MSDNYFNPVFTDVGRTAAADDTGQGLQTIITHVVMGDGKYSVRDAEGVALNLASSATALQNELLRAEVYSGGSPSPGALNLVAEVSKAIDSDPQFFISEVGFLNDDGILVAIWSSDLMNLGFRGDIMTWYLSLGLVWVDLPGEMFTVQVQNGPLAQQMLMQARLRNQVSDFVTSAGIDYDDQDETAVTRAITEKVGRLDVSVRRPICVFPENLAVDVSTTETLQGSKFFSADGYEHVATRFRVYDSQDVLVVDSGELSAVESYEISQDVLTTLTGYSWEVSYKGVLGSVEFWSEFSERASFVTSDVAAYNEPPILLLPADNAANVAFQPLLSISNYSVYPDAFDVVDAAQFQVFDDAELTNLIWDSGVLTSNFNNVSVGLRLEDALECYWTARHRGAVLGWTDYASANRFQVTNMALGAVMPDGGVIACQYDGYWLVCAPADKCGLMKFGLFSVNIALGVGSDELDPNDGVYNTDYLVGTYGDSAISAKFCRDVGSDYFLPNINELRAIARNHDLINSVSPALGVKFTEYPYIRSSTLSTNSNDYAVSIKLSDVDNSYGVGRGDNATVIPVRRIPV